MASVAEKTENKPNIFSSTLEGANTNIEGQILSIQEDVNGVLTITREIQLVESDGSLQMLVNADEDIKDEELDSKDKKQFSCSECGKAFVRAANLNRHMSTHSDSSAQKETAKQYLCCWCGLTFSSAFSLRHHTNHCHENEGPFTCNICSKELPTANSLMLHTSIHTGEHIKVRKNIEAMKCTVCDKGFCHKRSLDAHMAAEHSEEGKSFVCPTCGKRFSYQGTLNRHVALHSGTGRHYCEVCSRTFSSAYAVREHMRSHTAERPFTCQICGKTFARPRILKTHMVVHTKERAYKCDECGKTFCYASVLHFHKQTHSGDRPHNCPVCGKPFARPGNLKVHLKSHGKEQPYTCPICQKKFGYTSSLKQHLRLHAGERPFVCNICGKSFANSGNLKVHMVTHGKHPRYDCNVCGKQFAYLVTLRKHVVKQHGIDLPSSRSFWKKYAMGNDTEREEEIEGIDGESVTNSEEEQEVYMCSECGKVFTDVDSCAEHIESHNIQK